MLTVETNLQYSVDLVVKIKGDHGLHARIYQTLIKQEYELRPRYWNSKHTANFRRNSQATEKFQVQARQSYRRRWALTLEAYASGAHVPPRCTARTVLRTFCYLNWGPHVLGDEQQDQEDTGARAVHCGHQLEKDVPDTEHVKVLERPDSDLAGDGFLRKQNTTCPKRKASMKPNKRQLASWVLTTLCEMSVKSCDMRER